MNKQIILKQLEEYLNEIKSDSWKIDNLPKFHELDLMIKTPCYVTFFAVVDESHSVDFFFEKSLKQVIKVREGFGRPFPIDINLVILLPCNIESDYTSIREFVANRFTCRKYVLNVEPNNLKDILFNLPFFPPDNIGIGTEKRYGTKVQDVLKDYDSELISDLAGRSPGKDKIVAKIIGNQYNLKHSISKAETGRNPMTSRPVHRKLDALDVRDFRGIQRLKPQDMPLSGDIVLIYGPNGIGKTSIYDSIEWAITGRIERLKIELSQTKKQNQDPIINIFSEKKEAKVTCYFNEGEEISRTINENSTEKKIGGQAQKDDRSIIDHVVGAKAPSADAKLPIEDLRDLVCGSHMLSQHNIRNFLQATRPQQRFDMLTKMIGAEAFVRFRDKAIRVAKEIKSMKMEKEVNYSDLEAELTQKSDSVNQMKLDHETLSKSITRGYDPKDLASELIEQLIVSNFVVEADEKHELRSIVSNDNSELLYVIPIRIEEILTGKISNNDDKLIRLKGLEEKVRGNIDAKAQFNRLGAEIALVELNVVQNQRKIRTEDTKKSDNKDQVESIEIQTSRKNNLYDNSVWLKENLNRLGTMQSILSNKLELLKSQEKTIVELEVSRKSLQKEASQFEVEIEKETNQLVETSRRQQFLAKLIGEFTQVQINNSKVEQLACAKNDKITQINELKKQEILAKDDLNSASIHIADLQKKYDTEANRHEELSSILVRLSEMIRSAECPLCGRDFESIDEAKQTIKSQLTSLAPQLKELARQIQETNDANEKAKTKLYSIQNKVIGAVNESKALAAEIEIANQSIQKFIADCSAIGLKISVDEFEEVSQTLVNESEKTDTQQIKVKIDNAKRDLEKKKTEFFAQKLKITELRQIKEDGDQDFAHKSEMLKNFKDELTLHGFDCEQLPESERLEIDISTQKSKIAELNNLRERNIKLISESDNLIGVLRKSISEDQENITGKETQRRNYKTIVNEFTAACETYGIDEKDPLKSIEIAKSSILESSNEIGEIKKKNQMLSGLVKFKKMSDDIKELKNNISGLQQQADNNRIETKHLIDWILRFEKLERDVIRKQLDVVGAHLDSLEPVTQRLYKRLSSHPIFENVKIRVNDDTRELDFEAESSLKNNHINGMSVSPSAYFSEAQMNSLAITVFLAGALEQRWSGLRTILIDDPIQQMDEMNVYAFIDLIRGLSPIRQFIIFTCSRDFYMLAMDRLACLNNPSQKSFMAYRLEGTGLAGFKVYSDV